MKAIALCFDNIERNLNSENEMKDYNSLPVGNFRTLMVEAVDATDSAIMETGFPHFKYEKFKYKIQKLHCIFKIYWSEILFIATHF